jgi:retron-type reverse transcriptase
MTDHSPSHIRGHTPLDRGSFANTFTGTVVTKEAYGVNLQANLQDLHGRLKSMKYRHQPIRRIYIDKEGGKKRPIGISAVEDKIVQDSLRELLEAVYEQDFRDCSYGFRPGRSAHDALRALNGAVRRGEVNVVLEADIVSFFDRVDRKKLKQLLGQRLADKSLMRLIGKCLHVGILEGGVETQLDEGTVQGSTLSPILANVYLHHVLDVWFEDEIKSTLRGKAVLIRYCDDFVIGLQRPEEAQRVRALLGERLAAFWLGAAPGQDPSGEFPATAGRPTRGTRSGNLRPTRFYALLASEPSGSLAHGDQDLTCSPTTVRSSRLRLVPPPSAPVGTGAARRAEAQTHRALQLLQRAGVTRRPSGMSPTMHAGPGISGCADAATANASTGTGSTIYCGISRCPSPQWGSRCGQPRETYQRRSPVVEISSLGSGEGRGWVTGPGYSTSLPASRPEALELFGSGFAGLGFKRVR